MHQLVSDFTNLIYWQFTLAKLSKFIHHCHIRNYWCSSDVAGKGTLIVVRQIASCYTAGQLSTGWLCCRMTSSRSLWVRFQQTSAVILADISRLICYGTVISCAVRWIINSQFSANLCLEQVISTAMLRDGYKHYLFCAADKLPANIAVGWLSALLCCGTGNYQHCCAVGWMVINIIA